MSDGMVYDGMLFVDYRPLLHPIYNTVVSVVRLPANDWPRISGSRVSFQSYSGVRFDLCIPNNHGLCPKPLLGIDNQTRPLFVL